MGNVVPITITAQYSQENCQDCSAIFWVSESKMRRARDHGGSYWCPGCGTKWTFCENELKKARKQRDEARESRDWYRKRMESEKRSNTALKGVVTRAKRRIGHGVCPVQGCKRSFKNLQRHMKSKHPDYIEEEK